jgi:hypothetical protein
MTQKHNKRWTGSTTNNCKHFCHCPLWLLNEKCLLCVFQVAEARAKCWVLSWNLKLNASAQHLQQYNIPLCVQSVSIMCLLHNHSVVRASVLRFSALNFSTPTPRIIPKKIYTYRVLSVIRHRDTRRGADRLREIIYMSEVYVSFESNSSARPPILTFQKTETTIKVLPILGAPRFSKKRITFVEKSPGFVPLS